MSNLKWERGRLEGKLRCEIQKMTLQSPLIFVSIVIVQLLGTSVLVRLKEFILSLGYMHSTVFFPGECFFK